MPGLSEMKNILIVNTCSVGDRKLTGMVMWGAWAVASYFKVAILNSDVKYLDENNEDNFLEKFKKAVKDRDTVGFSITSMQIKYTLPLIKYIREHYPNIKIIVGGIHPILFPNQDYNGWADEWVSRDLPKDNFLYEFLPKKVKEAYMNKRAQIITGFNCSYKCAFCVNSVRDCKYESRPVEKICEDIEYVVKNFNPKEIYFRDEDFFQDFEKAKILTDYLLEKKYKFKWEALTRVNHFRDGRINNDFIKKLVDSGCFRFRMGVESGSQRVLNYLRKGQTVEQIKNAVKQCVDNNIAVNCSLITGLPTETSEEREETYKLIDVLSSYGKNVEILGPQMYRPYPGGLVYEDAKKFGLKLPNSFEEWETYYDKNPLGDISDFKTNYPWLTDKENRILPYAWIAVRYGCNYNKSKSFIKKIISFLFLFHWKLRWFSGWDIKLFMYLRSKYVKAVTD